MYPRLMFFAAGILAVATAFGQTPFEPLAPAIRSQALSLPATTNLVSLTPADKDHRRQSYAITRTFAADGTFTVTWKSGTVESSQIFRPDGTLVSGTQTDTVHGLTVATQTDPGRRQVRTLITENGKTKSDKKSDLKPAIVLRDEMQHLILQAWQYGVRDGLKFQSLSPDGGMVGDFQIVFTPTADPTALSTKYTYPDEFLAALKGHSNFMVADMSLQGIGALFYPHHFYLVYLTSPAGLEWVGYFGEDPKKPVFQYKS